MLMGPWRERTRRCVSVVLHHCTDARLDITKIMHVFKVPITAQIYAFTPPGRHEFFWDSIVALRFPALRPLLCVFTKKEMKLAQVDPP